MLDAKTIKEYARELGADIVGIASMDRFEGAPPQMDPRFIMPKAKSMIVMGFRVMRGSLRGIEEGTFFSNYSAMGYGGLTYLYIPMTVIPYVIDNTKFPDDWFEVTSRCDKKCHQCNYCNEVMDQVLVNTEAF